MSKGAYADEYSGDTGRNAWREVNEIGPGNYILRRPFWRDEAEEFRWLYAVESCRPHGVGIGYEALAAHLDRIASKVGARLNGPAAKEMHAVARLPYKEQED